MPAKGTIPLEDLQLHFHLPMAEVAKRFGVCTTFFKKVCRTHGIKRWPFRKLKSLQKKITHLKSFPGNDALDHSKVNHLQQRLEELRKLQPRATYEAEAGGVSQRQRTTQRAGRRARLPPVVGPWRRK